VSVPVLAVEDVVAGAGVEHVVEAVAGEVGGAGAEDAAVLDVCAEGVAAQIAVDQVGAAGARGGVGFADEVAHVPDVVGVRAVMVSPVIVSFPAPPSRTLAPLLPVRRSA
jgi:hypothetical protein